MKKKKKAVYNPDIKLTKGAMLDAASYDKTQKIKVTVDKVTVGCIAGRAEISGIATGRIKTKINSTIKMAKAEIMKCKFLIIVAVMAVGVSGCNIRRYILQDANKDEIKRQDYVREHPEIENALKTAIIEGRAVVGMNKEQLRFIYGNPCSTRTTLPPGYTIWFYNCSYADDRGTPYKGFYFPVDGNEILFLSHDDYKKGLANKRRERYITEHLNLAENIKKAILAGQVLIGMTKEDVTASWGNPENINRSVGSWGVHEQWVYGSIYIYFEDGKMTSWQD